MNTFRSLINKDIPKGGLLGALLGTLASTQVHKKDDTLTRKAVKTGLLAGIGFAIGVFTEKIIHPKTN
jgi:hypothetical protein